MVRAPSAYAEYALLKTAWLVHREDSLADYSSSLKGAVRVYRSFKWKRRADDDPKIACIEMGRSLLKNRCLPHSMLGPSEYRASM